MLLGIAWTAQGAQPARKTSKTAKPPSKAAPPLVAVLEPKAKELLRVASARLAAARALKFTAVVSYESPSRFGPALVYTTKSEVTMQRPDKLKVVTPGDGPASEFYYDGRTMMAFAPAENLVAVAEAPPTIDAALQSAFHLAEIYFPFSDLIAADPYAVLADGMKFAFYIGQSNMVGSATTDMVAFASDDVFAQIWIGAEDKLPRRMRAVYRRDPLQLRHDMELLNWQLDPAVTPDAFSLAKTQGEMRIKFAHPSAMVGPRSAAKAKPSPTQSPKTK
jgi:hypothetical protein